MVRSRPGKTEVCTRRGAESAAPDMATHQLTDLICGRQREVECRTRSRCRFQPHPAAKFLDSLPAEREPQSISGVFLSVEAFENLEDSRLKCGFYTRAIVFH